MRNLKLSRAGMEALMNSPEMQKELKRRAERVARQANANAPVGETGELSQSHRVEMDTSPGTKGAFKRARARIVSDKKYAAKIEAATGYLTSALDAGA